MKWPEDRLDELDLLQLLVNEVQSINRGSHVIERLTRCIELAEKLDRTDYGKGRHSLMAFIRDVSRGDRDT